MRVPKNAVERQIHFDLLEIKESLADPRIWVGHYQHEDVVYGAVTITSRWLNDRIFQE